MDNRYKSFAVNVNDSVETSHCFCFFNDDTEWYNRVEVCPGFCLVFNAQETIACYPLDIML